MTVEPAGAPPPRPAGGTALVPIDSLRPADSPRRNGIDEAHAAVLAESYPALPPILVHRRSMRVIDGMHRLRAAQLRGVRRVAVRYFEGDGRAAFVRAVTANVTHGLPLSLADREAAAVRIMSGCPYWSDGCVAAAAGVSDKKVAALRRRTTPDPSQLNGRIGRDGRVRPLDGAVGRRRAGEFLTANPGASLREVARATGVSPATARDVRIRLRRGESPVTASQQAADASRPDGREARSRHPVATRRSRGEEPVDPQSVLDRLRQDPSLRYTDAGRTLLRWLDRHLVESAAGVELVAAAPPHCLPMIAGLVRHCTVELQLLAEQLEDRLREASLT